MYEKTELKLKKLKKELKKRSKDIKKSLMSQRSKDWEEAAVEAENDEVLEAIYSETTDELRQVKFALKRIATGDYGDCSECGETINTKRLEIMPFTALCIKCAQDLEYQSR
jgi:RNA polymerase-binding transcription factor DksA